ncbi:MAG: hypothetical protein H5T59_04675 [Anaerolineae bacterium]|nr:hypothetical protein [Anaerolineae bacterium]
MKRAGLVVTIWMVLALGSLLGGLIRPAAAALPLAQATTSTPPVPASPTPTPEPSGVVHMLLFYSPTCPHCHDIITNYLPVLDAKYGDRIEVYGLNVQDPAAYGLLLAIEEKAGLPENQRGGVPAMLVGEELFIGANMIREHLEEAVDRYLAEGGVDLPIPREYLVQVTPTPAGAQASPPAPSTAQPTATPAPPPSPTPEARPIHMAYFYKVGCAECDRVTYDINYLKHLYPQLQADVFDIQEHAAFNEWLCDQYGLPPSQRLLTPIVFIGDDYLLGDEASLKNMEALIQKYASTGAEARWKDWAPEQEQQAASRIVERFRSMGALTVALAALVDGLNPCAFATLILFISYLALTGRKGREILLVGFAFALGVFATYLLVGVGILKFLAELPFLKTIGRWIYGATAVLCLVLAVLSLNDYFKARRGQAEEMRLRLPLRLRRWVNRVIRESMGVRAFALSALVTGFLVSLIELACTGQVYLPTILFVLGIPEMRARAFAYLLLYNLVFILPLVVVFVLAYLGTSSEKLTIFLSRHTSTIKLATAALFLLLAGGLAFYVV